MKKMNIPLMAALLALSIVVCPVLYFAVGPTLDATKFETLKILVIIAACSAAFCFIVGESTGNNSQNALVLMTTFPALVAMRSDAPFGAMDVVAAVLMLGFIVWETVADEHQWRFQKHKWAMIDEGKKLEELPAPYNKGFITTGLWNRSRHPNYFAEQAIWVCFYLFSIGAGMGVFNWSMVGALLLLVLFQGSSSLAEEISASKYPEYEHYCQSVARFFPGKRYEG